MVTADCDATSLDQYFAYNQTILQLSVADGECVQSGSIVGAVLTVRTCADTRLQRFAYDQTAGLVWNPWGLCLEAVDTGSGLRMAACEPDNSRQHWRINGIATTTQTPVSMGFHVRLKSGICLAAKDGNLRSSLQMRSCDVSDDLQTWFYDESLEQFRNGLGKCLMAPHAGGIRQAKLSFTPVRGGEGIACRGTDWRDNDRSNYIPFLRVDDLETCQGYCSERASCTGIEFNPKMRRCEVWTKAVQTGVIASNFQCYTASLEDPTLAIFEEVDGGSNRVCRGESPGDNKASYFKVTTAESKEDCQRQCSMATGYCTGFEYHKSGRCELWLKPVGASVAVSGYHCRALATVVMEDCNTSDFRQLWHFDTSNGIISSKEDGACLGAVGTGKTEGGRLRLLTCNAASSSQVWMAVNPQIEEVLAQRRSVRRPAQSGVAQGEAAEAGTYRPSPVNMPEAQLKPAQPPQTSLTS